MQLYVHIPFCKSKCAYCDFTSYPNCEDKTILRYLTTLIDEIKLASKAYKSTKISTIYIGGGTPSLLSASQIAPLFCTIRQSFDLSEIEEYTIECNPESLQEEKLDFYKQAGINRLSIGVQSLSDDNLRDISRVHNAQIALEKLALAKKYFDNLSCDLILGLPHDNEEIVRGEIATLAPLVKHLSMYELILEEGTPLFDKVKKSQIKVANDDEVATLFEIAIDEAKRWGFARYEVSNFAKEGYHSRHNFGYWTRVEYLGLGAAASSFYTHDKKQIRVSNFKSLSEYESAICSARDKSYFDIERDESVILDEKDVKNEQIMLGLRTSQGVEKSLLDDRISPLLQQFFVDDGKRVALNDKGLAVMNSIVCELLD